MLDLRVEVRGSVNDILTESRRNGARSVTRVMGGTAQSIKAAWRGEITGAGLGTRLANTVRAQAYPQAGFSMNAAALVWTRASKIVGAFERGATIRAQDGFWLAIPLGAAMKSGRGGRITPGEWESRTGRRLRFVYRPGRAALLVDDGTRIARGGGRLSKGQFGPKLARVSRRQTVPIFALVPQVTLRKRLNLYTTALRLANGIPQRIVAGWRS